MNIDEIVAVTLPQVGMTKAMLEHEIKMWEEVGTPSAKLIIKAAKRKIEELTDRAR